MNYLVYILKCNDNSFYVGITVNILKRLREHKLGFTPYTKNRRPVKLMHEEMFDSRSKAAKREKEIKGWRREKKQKLINSLR